MATEAPPAPPSQAPIIHDLPPPAPPPPPTSTIQVVPQPVEPKPAPKPGSAKERMFQELRNRAKGQVIPKPADEPKEEPAPSDEPPSGVLPEVTPPDPNAPPAPKKKVNPWEIVDTWKKRAADAEAKLSEMAKAAVNPAEKAALEDKLKSLEQRNQEVEEEIKFTNYLKSREYQEQYEKPYEQEWERTMMKFGELTVIDPDTQEERGLTSGDILEVVNMKLGPARDLAESRFGHFANDIMNAREKILDLFQKKQTAIETARKSSEEREKMTREQMDRQISQAQESIKSSWQKANEAALNDPHAGKYFKPVEGDEDSNKRLQRGYAMVDQALSENALAPNLTQEQRDQIVQRQAAVRHRAAAFGRVLAANNELEKKVKELTDRLNAYEESEPPAGGSTQQPEAHGAGMSAMERMRQELRKRAK